MDPTGLTMAAAAAGWVAGRLARLGLPEAYRQRIERRRPTVTAYSTVPAGRARADARRATEDIAAGRYRGPLHGIPLGLKDLFDTAGIRTTAGSRVHATHVPARDATVTRRLAEAGAV